LALVVLPGLVVADDIIPLPDEEVVPEVAPGGKSPHCLRDLKHVGLSQLEDLFTAAQCGGPPVGYCRGRVLYLFDTRHPRVHARMTGCVWKGKCFDEDGSFINQWCGFQALHSQADEGCSWLDGGPCVVLQYPPGTPLFANMRDEVREIAPGLYLGLMWERYPSPRMRGYFAMEVEAHNERHHR
jgi:hypothetical protein